MNHVLPSSRRTLVVVLAAVAGLTVLAVLSPAHILRATTPTGGDMGAHVLGPAYLREVLIPSGRLLGWSNSWFAGFPAFYFYFPLPSLVIVALDLVLPYGVAFKLVSVLGLLTLPAASYYLARSLALPRPSAIVSVGAGAAFVFMESFTIYGGNIASTLAGEFSFSWSFTLGFVYLGLLVRAVRDDRRYVPWAALVLGLTALSHILTTIVLVIASLSVLAWRGAARVAVPIWAWGFAVAGFWALPLLMRIAYSSDMAWTPLTRLEELFPIEIWLVLPAAVAGAVWAARRRAPVLPMLVATLVPVVYYPLPNLLPAWFPGLFPDEPWKLWNGRLLPYWYYGVLFFAAVGVGALVVAVARRLPDRVQWWWPRLVAAAAALVGVDLIRTSELPPWAPWLFAAGATLAITASLVWRHPVSTSDFLAVTFAAVVGLGALAGLNYVDGWARWNYEGYESKQGWPEYIGLMETIDGLEPGRVVWEQDSTPRTGLDRFGTPMSPMLIPYWTGWTHPSMEGLYFESSLTTPFHFVLASEMSHKPSNPIPRLQYRNFSFDRGVAHMRLYGVRYYVSYSEAAREEALAQPQLQLVAESPPFAVFEIDPPPLVEVAAHQPAVYEEPSAGLFAAGGEAAEAQQPVSFNELALDWYDDLSLIDRWVTAAGPSHWPRISSLAELPDRPLSGVPQNAVSEVTLDHHRISFRTTAVGVPHLVKVSYFPNWEARGAEGPWRATPSLMVVVPTSEEVVLEFRRQWPEWVGWGLTLLGLAALAVAPLRRRAGRSGG